MKDHTFGKSGYDRRKVIYGTDKPRRPKESMYTGGAPDPHKVSRDMDGVRGSKKMSHKSSHGY